MGCHGLNAVSGLIIPDLRGSAWLHDPDGWNSVVREGLLSKNGMASFGEQLSREESDAIRAYVIQQAWRGKELQEAQAAKD
jgi:mono/diheme cytochrome c family protein